MEASEMRLGPYYLYSSTMVSVVVAAAVQLPLLAWDATSLAAAIFGVVGLHCLGVGALVASDWRGVQRRLRAIQRVQSRGRGRAWHWFCRDSRTWWRANGILLIVCGAVFIGTATASL